MEQALERVRDDGEAESRVETALSYTADQPVVVRVRRNDKAYDLDDGGAAVRLAGAPEGWLDQVEGLALAQGANIDEHGVVSISAVGDRELASQVLSVADTSVSLYYALSQSGVSVEFDSDTSVE